MARRREQTESQRCLPIDHRQLGSELGRHHELMARPVRAEPQLRYRLDRGGSSGIRPAPARQGRTQARVPRVGRRIPGL